MVLNATGVFDGLSSLRPSESEIMPLKSIKMFSNLRAVRKMRRNLQVGDFEPLQRLTSTGSEALP